MKKIVIGRKRMCKSGIISVSAFAVQLFFILKKNKSFKHLVHSFSVVFSGL